jgi:hypothetical protein
MEEKRESKKMKKLLIIGVIMVLVALTVNIGKTAMLSLPDGTITANRQDSCTGGSEWFGESITTLTIDGQNLEAGQHVEISGSITGMSAPGSSWVEIGLIPKDRWDFWQNAFGGAYKAAVFDKGLHVVHWYDSGLGLSLHEGWDDWALTTYKNDSGPFAWPLATPTVSSPWDFTIQMYPTSGNDGNAYLSVTGGTLYGSQPFSYGGDAGQSVTNDNDYSESYLIAQIWSTTENATLSFTDVQAAVVPIPGAVWLLASGMIGLIAIRRKFKK